MAAAASLPSGAILIGSFPAETEEKAMTRITSALPDRLRSVPDGEVGARIQYVMWQSAVFPPAVVREIFRNILGIPAPDPGSSGAPYTLDSVKPTGYDDAAIASYQKFKKLRETGVIGPEVKFQVSLPTPYGVVRAIVQTEHGAIFEPLYEQRMFRSIARIFENIPQEDLVLQFDLALETIRMEMERGASVPDRTWDQFELPATKGTNMERLLRYCEQVPAGFPLGFHLCFGDLGHRAGVEPSDLQGTVDFANSITEQLGTRNPVRYIHMPVPRHRTDAAYYAPLRKLDLRGGKLYLGLVHAHDLDGTHQRIISAQDAFPHGFGVSTECGLGRTPAEDIASILSIMKDVTPPEKHVS